MGNCRSSTAVSREATVVLLGLDDSGKSTLVANLCGESTEGKTPTRGFSSYNIELNNFRLTLYDLGGGARLRNIWKNYYSEVYGSIFVIDSNALNRLGESKEVLSGIVRHEKMRGKPLLIFANKQDSNSAISDHQINEQLDIQAILGEHKHLSNVVMCTALKSACNNKCDPSIKEGIRWLLNQIGQRYNQIHQRVSTDVKEQRAAEAHKRRERAERVRQIKEERERQRKLAGVANEEEIKEEPDGGNPFKPIEQAMAETEARENATKAREREIQDRLNALQGDLQVSADTSRSAAVSEKDIHEQPQDTHKVSARGSTTGAVLSEEKVQEQLSKEKVQEQLNALQDSCEVSAAVGDKEIQEQDNHKVCVGESTAREGETQEQLSADHRVLVEESISAAVPTEAAALNGEKSRLVEEMPAEIQGSQSMSGLSASSDSLTDVTPQSNASSSISLQPPPPLASSSSQNSTQMSIEGEKKKKKRSMLLTRLKNRNKTAPILNIPPSGPLNTTREVSSDPSMCHAPRPLVNTNTWMAADLEQIEPQSSLEPDRDQSSSQIVGSNMEGLPELPQKKVILPPIKISKSVGGVDKVLITEEDIAILPQTSIMQFSQPPSPPLNIEPLSS